MPRSIRARLVWAVAVPLVGAFAVGLLEPQGLSPRILLALVVIAALTLLLTTLVARGIERPLAHLSRLARDTSASGGAGTFVVEGPEEIEALAAALRRMAAAMRAQHRTAEVERDRLAALIDDLDEAILIAEAGDRIVLANRTAKSLLPGAPLDGHRLVEVLRDHEAIDAVSRAWREGHAAATIDRAEPRRFVRAIARRLDETRLLLVLQDLTELHRLETVRQDFVANVSHELRTPLASLKAMAETLEEGALDDPPVARDFVRRMHREIDELTQLVTELLNLTRIESGEQRLATLPLAPRDLVGDAVRRLGALAVRAGVELVADEVPDLPPVKADGERVAQVFANLIHNATKFTPAGGVIRVGASAAPGAVAFRVTDTGAGIPAGDLARIFERFYKADRSRASGGTGLGLAIAKHIVQAHGGSLTAASDGPGRGATFTFTLPLA